MNNPLRDWRLVAVLGAAALGAIGYNVVRPLLAGGAAASDEANIVTTETSANVDTSAVIDDNAHSRTSRVHQTAIERFPEFTDGPSLGRDPFATIEHPERTQATIAATGGEPIRPTNPEVTPKVTAIVITEHWRAAILAGRLVAPGTRVAGLTVDRIEPEGVVLRDTARSPTFLAVSGVRP